MAQRCVKRHHDIGHCYLYDALLARYEHECMFLCLSFQSEELCGDEGGEERAALHRDGPG